MRNGWPCLRHRGDLHIALVLARRSPPDDPALEDITAIVHCAGLSAPPFGPRQAFHRANVLGTQAVLDFARARDVRRLVFISSPSVYFALRDQLNVPEDMDLPPRPFNAYAASKVAAEARVLAARDLGPVILRPRGLYGPGGDTALLPPRLLRTAQARSLPPRFRGGTARIDLTYIDDAARAVLAALRAGGPSVERQVFNISGGEVIRIRDIVEDACARAGITPPGGAIYRSDPPCWPRAPWKRSHCCGGTNVNQWSRGTGWGGCLPSSKAWISRAPGRIWAGRRRFRSPKVLTGPLRQRR